jgi:hypothetical protein
MLSEQEILHIENATLENALRFVAEKFKDSAVFSTSLGPVQPFGVLSIIIG